MFENDCFPSQKFLSVIIETMNGCMILRDIFYTLYGRIDQIDSSNNCCILTLYIGTFAMLDVTCLEKEF